MDWKEITSEYKKGQVRGLEVVGVFIFLLLSLSAIFLIPTIIIFIKFKEKIFSTILSIMKNIPLIYKFVLFQVVFFIFPTFIKNFIEDNRLNLDIWGSNTAAPLFSAFVAFLSLVAMLIPPTILPLLYFQKNKISQKLVDYLAVSWYLGLFNFALLFSALDIFFKNAFFVFPSILMVPLILTTSGFMGAFSGVVSFYTFKDIKPQSSKPKN